MSTSGRPGGRRAARWATRAIQRPAWALSAGAVGVAVTAALPWLRTGGRSISGFHLAVLAERFGLTNSATSVLADLWLLAPFAAAVSIALAAIGWRRAAGAVGAGVVLIGVAAAGVFLKIAGGASAPWPWLTISICVVSSAVAAAGLHRKRTAHGSEH